MAILAMNGVQAPAVKFATLDVLPEMLPMALMALPSSCRVTGSLMGPPGVVRLRVEGPDLPGKELGIECTENSTTKQFRLVSDAIVKPSNQLVM
jgi:hypothetical protein